MNKGIHNRISSQLNKFFHGSDKGKSSNSSNVGKSQQSRKVAALPGTHKNRALPSIPKASSPSNLKPPLTHDKLLKDFKIQLLSDSDVASIFTGGYSLDEGFDDSYTSSTGSEDLQSLSEADTDEFINPMGSQESLFINEHSNNASFNFHSSKESLDSTESGFFEENTSSKTGFDNSKVSKREKKAQKTKGDKTSERVKNHSSGNLKALWQRFLRRVLRLSQRQLALL